MEELLKRIENLAQRIREESMTSGTSMQISINALVTEVKTLKKFYGSN